MGLSAYLTECLSTRTSTSVYFVGSAPYSLYIFFKFCICFAHELVRMWFGHSSIFHLMNISILGISDAVNGCFREHTSSELFNFWCIPVLLIIIMLNKCGVLCYTPRSEICVECPSVRPSDCPFFTFSVPFSILSVFQLILFKLYIRIDIWEE